MVDNEDDDKFDLEVKGLIFLQTALMVFLISVGKEIGDA